MIVSLGIFLMSLFLGITFLAIILWRWSLAFLFAVPSLIIGSMLGDNMMHGFFGSLVVVIIGSVLIVILYVLQKLGLLRPKRRALKTSPSKFPVPSAPRQTLSEPEEPAIRSLSAEERLRDEPVTAILRRQIPIRFDEEPRSWLGGLPCMAKDVAWPTAMSVEYPDKGEIALNFVAQICCADLPEKLWGGRGPRDGWLLVFLDAHDPGIDEYPDGLQVLHIDELGPERQPLLNIQTVQSPDYTGARYDHVRSPEGVPVRWRKWPVDIVEFPESIDQHISSEKLYPGEILDAGHGDYRVEDINDPDNWPFTRRGALYAIDCVIRIVRDKYKDKSPVTLSDAHRQVLNQSNAVSAVLDQHDNRISALTAMISSARKQRETEENVSEKTRLDRFIPLREAWLKDAIRLREDFVQYDKPGGNQALLAEIEQGLERFSAWRNGLENRLEELRTEIMSRDLDTGLSPDDYRKIHDKITAETGTYLGFRTDRDTKTEWLGPAQYDIVQWYSRGLAAAMQEATLDAYCGSPKTKGLIPDHVLAKLEPRLKHETMLHKMGGFHQGVQSQVDEVPPYLLIQIASDDALTWNWGGANYARIDKENLTAARFDRLDWWLET